LKFVFSVSTSILILKLSLFYATLADQVRFSARTT